MHSRRSFISNVGLLTTATVLTGCNTELSKNDEKHIYQDKYDLSNYEENLEAFVKVMGDVSGKPSFLGAEGRIYAIRDREQAFPLCSIKGMRYCKFEKTTSGYRHYTRDWAFYCDLETGKPIDQYKNPITGETVKTKQILTGFFNWEWTPNGQFMDGFKGSAWLMNKPLLFPFTRQGNDMSVFLELLVQYQSGAAGDEVMEFMFDANDLNNPNISSVPMRFSWTGNSAFMRWLNMGNIKGRTLWQSTGRKYSSISDLSPEFRAAAETYFPGSLESPETYDKVSYTTMPDTENRKTVKDDQ